MNSSKATGLHLIADLQGISADILCDSSAIEILLKEAAIKAGATIIYSHFHGFGKGLGITGVVILAESHISIHTWPEHGFAAVDIFMCGMTQPRQALDAIIEALSPASRQIQYIERGAKPT